jgi:hypothetical protein
MIGNCSRCGGALDKRTSLYTVTSLHGGVSTDGRLCWSCAMGLSTWFAVRKDEFPAGDDPQGWKRTTIEAELLHACRVALDYLRPHPPALDTVRTAIKRAVE